MLLLFFFIIINSTLTLVFVQCKRFDAVIHFAGLKAVGESVAHPFRYFDNNLIGSLNLYQTMAKHNCKKVSFFRDF